VEVLFAVKVPVDAVPLVGLGPVNVPPDPVHDVALVVDQLSVAEPPEVTVIGLAVNVVTVGCGVTVTVAVALAGVVPVAPAQVTE
jgi:hypothetical protein